MKCAYCGKEIEEQKNFCPYCGRKQERHCPKCGNVVASTEKFCSKCGAPLSQREDINVIQSPNQMKQPQENSTPQKSENANIDINLLRIGLAAIAIIIVGCIALIMYNNKDTSKGKESSANYSTVPSETQQATQPASHANFQIGDVINTDKFAFEVTDAYIVDDLGEWKKIPEGAIYVVVEYEYKNISTQPISSFSLPSVHLMDGNGAIYDEDFDARMNFNGSYNDSKIISDMNPGIKTKSNEIFEVAIDVLNAGNMAVYVEADKKFLVDLNLQYGYGNDLNVMSGLDQGQLPANSGRELVSGLYRDDSENYAADISVSVYSSSDEEINGYLPVAAVEETTNGDSVIEEIIMDSSGNYYLSSQGTGYPIADVTILDNGDLSVFYGRMYRTFKLIRTYPAS